MSFISLFGSLSHLRNVTFAHVSSYAKSSHPVLITPESDVTAPLLCPLCWKLFLNGSVEATALGFYYNCIAVIHDWPDVKLNLDASNDANRSIKIRSLKRRPVKATNRHSVLCFFSSFICI